MNSAGQSQTQLWTSSKIREYMLSTPSTSRHTFLIEVVAFVFLFEIVSDDDEIVGESRHPAADVSSGPRKV